MLFTLISIQNKKDRKQPQNLVTKWKMTEYLRVKGSLFQTSYTIFSILCIKTICIKSNIYVIGGPSVILEIQVEGLSLEFEFG